MRLNDGVQKWQPAEHHHTAPLLGCEPHTFTLTCKPWLRNMQTNQKAFYSSPRADAVSSQGLGGAQGEPTCLVLHHNCTAGTQHPCVIGAACQC